MTIYSHAKPPKIDAQTFTEESLADQLADEPLKRIFERYVTSGMAPKLVDGDVDIDASAADVDAALSDLSDADALLMSKVEQQDVLATAQRLVEQLQNSAVNRQKSAKTDAGAPGAKAAPTEPLKESKVDTEPKNG